MNLKKLVVGRWLASKSKHIYQHSGICPRPLALFPKREMGTSGTIILNINYYQPFI